MRSTSRGGIVVAEKLVQRGEIRSMENRSPRRQCVRSRAAAEAGRGGRRSRHSRQGAPSGTATASSSPGHGSTTGWPSAAMNSRATAPPVLSTRSSLVSPTGRCGRGARQQLAGPRWAIGASSAWPSTSSASRRGAADARSPPPSPRLRVGSDGVEDGPGADIGDAEAGAAHAALRSVSCSPAVRSRAGSPVSSAAGALGPGSPTARPRSLRPASTGRWPRGRGARSRRRSGVRRP